MSDTILRVFPADPEFVPDRTAAARAAEDARLLFSGRWVEVQTTVSEQVVFVDNPCCGTQVRIDELVYHRPVGFARFVLDVWNPDPSPNDLASVTQRLGASMGSPVRAIWAHY